MSMEHRQLGDSDLQVSAISLGSWLTYSGGVGRDQTEACTRAAFDAGITFFDTANVYGRGASETAWGEILRDYDRSSYTLATKVYFPMSARDRGLSRGQILKQIDASLERLQVDYVDLYQCHRYDDDVELAETMGALTEVVEAGKARYIGFSEWPVERVREALELPGVAKFVSSQPQYSALWRGPEARADPAVRAQRDLADRLVAARAGRADRQVQAGRAAAGGLARDLEGDERLHRAPDGRRDARGRPAARADRRGGRAVDGAAGARVGAAPAQRGVGDHRRDPA